MRLFVSGILLLSSQFATAASNCDINAIVRHVWPEAKQTVEGLITQSNQIISTTGNTPQSAICRIWPAHPELTLAAVPLMSQEQDDDYHTGDLALLVLDSATLDIKQRLDLPERMSDDAFRITHIALDTARWRITPDQTAFGLRIDRSASSRVNPFHQATLSLYLIDHSRLRTILNGVVLEDSVGEWDGMCAGKFRETKRTLALDTASHHGYADIRVSEKSMLSTAYVDANNQCTEQSQSDKATWLLPYDSAQYTIPEKLVPLP